MADFAIQVTRWKEVTEKEALDEDWDQIPTLTAFAKTLDFCQKLENHRLQLEALISRHLGIPTTDFVLLGRENWIWGSFNLCLQLDIMRTPRTSKLPPQAILRFPLPFRCGEEYSPGNVEEKLRCEAATYIWLRRNCPSIPTPRLLAMGFPGSESYTAIGQESLLHRVIWQVTRCFAWIRGETLIPYFRHERDGIMSDSGYLLLEYVMDGAPLSSSWQEHCQDEVRRQNLFRGMSRILLDLANVPLPRIGSWTLNKHGVISLTNRPVLDLTMLWNRHEIPTGIPRDRTYTSAVSFMQDMLAYQDNRLRHQRNAILNREDGVAQLSQLVALRAMFPLFWKQNSQDDEFVLTLPDLHKSNIFVDDDWNIVGAIDFEFAPVQPRQMVNVPHWLSDKSIDELYGPGLDEYKQFHDLFIEILEQEENARQYDNKLSRQMREDWHTGKLWYNAALRSINGFPLVFNQHLRPRFFEKFTLSVEASVLMPLWTENCEEFIAAKVLDKERYDERVREIFAAARELAGETKIDLPVENESLP